MSTRALFIDPGTKSTGWALFEDGQPRMHGTITANEAAHWSQRVGEIAGKYRELAVRLQQEGWVWSSCYFERIPNLCASEVWYSVGGLAVALAPYSTLESDPCLNPPIWQKLVGWNSKPMNAAIKIRGSLDRGLSEGSPLEKYISHVSSPDELAALGMGIAFYRARATSGASDKSNGPSSSEPPKGAR